MSYLSSFFYSDSEDTNKENNIFRIDQDSLLKLATDSPDKAPVVACIFKINDAICAYAYKVASKFAKNPKYPGNSAYSYTIKYSKNIDHLYTYRYILLLSLKSKKTLEKLGVINGKINKKFITHIIDIVNNIDIDTFNENNLKIIDTINKYSNV